jgi:hypothetical protein
VEDKMSRRLNDALGKMTFDEHEEMVQKYGEHCFCGYLRIPTLIRGKVDRVNAHCALRDEPGYVCTRRLPIDMENCPIYSEFQRQCKLQEEMRKE